MHAMTNHVIGGNDGKGKEGKEWRRLRVFFAFENNNFCYDYESESTTCCAL